MAVSVGLGAFLVFSNVAIIPAIIYSYVRRLFPETSLLIGVLAASTAFHLCQVEWFCFGTELIWLQVTDHFMVYTSLVWFSLYFAGAAERARTAITIGTMAVTLPVILTFLGTMMDGVIIVAITLVLTVIAMTYAVYVHGGPPVAWSPFVVAVGLLAAGVFLHVFGGDFGPENIKYPVAHSIWHILSMLALYYILGIPYRDDSALDHAYCSSGDHARIGKREFGPSQGDASRPNPDEISIGTQAISRSSVLPPLSRLHRPPVAAAAETVVGSSPNGRRSMRGGRPISLGFKPDSISII